MRMSTFQINCKEMENQTILICEIQYCFSTLKLQDINFVENMFIVRITITHDDSKEEHFSIKKYMGLKILKLIHVIYFHLFLFKWFENKELAKIQWVENYKQDFNFVVLEPCVYIIYMEHCVLLKRSFNLQQSSLGIYRP